MIILPFHMAYYFFKIQILTEHIQGHTSNNGATTDASGNHHHQSMMHFLALSAYRSNARAAEVNYYYTIRMYRCCCDEYIAGMASSTRRTKIFPTTKSFTYYARRSQQTTSFLSPTCVTKTKNQQGQHISCQ